MADLRSGPIEKLPVVVYGPGETQPRVPVMRLGNVLAIVPLFAEYPRCVDCGMLVVSGRDMLARLLCGEVGGVCHVCDPLDWPGYRTHYFESRYDKL